MEKSDLSITVWNHKASSSSFNQVQGPLWSNLGTAEWLQTVSLRDRFFCPTLTWIIDSFLLTIKYCFYIWKKKHDKGFQKFMNTLRWDIMWHCDVILTLQWCHGLMCGCSLFIFPTGWYRVFEIEFSHMGKISWNTDLVCKTFYVQCSPYITHLIITWIWIQEKL